MPATNGPAPAAAFSGAWGNGAWNGALDPLIIEQIDADGTASVVYAWGTSAQAASDGLLRAHLLDGCDYEKLLLVDPMAIRPLGSPFVQHIQKYEAAFAGVADYLHRAILQAYVRSAVHRPIDDAVLEPILCHGSDPSVKPAFYRQSRKWT